MNSRATDNSTVIVCKIRLIGRAEINLALWDSVRAQVVANSVSVFRTRRAIAAYLTLLTSLHYAVA